VVVPVIVELDVGVGLLVVVVEPETVDVLQEVIDIITISKIQHANAAFLIILTVYLC